MYPNHDSPILASDELTKLLSQAGAPHSATATNIEQTGKSSKKIQSGLPLPQKLSYTPQDSLLSSCRLSMPEFHASH